MIATERSHEVGTIVFIFEFVEFGTSPELSGQPNFLYLLSSKDPHECQFYCKVDVTYWLAINTYVKE